MLSNVEACVNSSFYHQHHPLVHFNSSKLLCQLFCLYWINVIHMQPGTQNLQRKVKVSLLLIKHMISLGNDNILDVILVYCHSSSSNQCVSGIITFTK